MFTVIGEALIDLVQAEPGGAYVARPGGGPLNVAVALRRLGHQTELMARLSDGSLGDVVRRHAEHNQLGLSASVSSPAQATLALATLDPAGQASYDFYVNGTADWGWTNEELAGIPASTRVLHTGSLAAAIEPGAGAVLGRVEGLYAAGGVLVSYDPNVRPTLAGDRVEAVARVERFVAAAHVVKASDDDIGWLYPEAAAVDVLTHWLGLGAELVVMTRGAAGWMAVRGTSPPVEAAAPTVRVVDTIGAGDAFMAGLLSGLADGGCVAPGSVDAMPERVLTSVLHRSGLVSALTCGRAGADPPTREELG